MAGPPLLAVATVAGLWRAATTVWGVRPVLLPPPDAVLAVFARRPGDLADHAWVTVVQVAVGYSIAVLVGLSLGLLLGGLPAVARAVRPLLVGFDAVPKLALAPMLVVWLGFGATPKVVMVVLVCLLPIVIATAAGLTRTPVEAVELARSLDASGWQTFTKIRLPYAAPQILVGLKLAAPLAVIGAVIGELFGATAGLGYLIQIAGTDTALAFASLFVLAGISMTLFYSLSAVGRLLLPWDRHTHT